jgi:hypothetical protein
MIVVCVLFEVRTELLSIKTSFGFRGPLAYYRPICWTLAGHSNCILIAMKERQSGEKIQ